MYRSGRHFLQLPGPTNVPDRVLRAIDRPTIDHRGPEFAGLTAQILEDLAPVFGTDGPIFIFPSSASGAWEAAIANTLSPGDRVLFFDQGFFAAQWHRIAERFGLEAELAEVDPRQGLDPARVEELLLADRDRRYRAVMVVHNETSTAVTTRIAGIRAAIDRADHPALLMVDAVSSLASMPYHHDEWGVDVTIAGSQKGLMLPPGLAFNAVSDKALAAEREATLPRSYWRWDEMRTFNADGFFPYTPATNLLFGLREALAMLAEEGLEAVYRRHGRLAEATRRAVRGWELEIYCRRPEDHSDTVTAVLTPEGVDADELRRRILERFDLSLGTGLGRLKGRVFRIGHLGDFNELMLAGTLCGVEMGLAAAGVGCGGGVAAALEVLGDRGR